MNILYLRVHDYRYPPEINFKDQNDKCWPMAINEINHKVIGWLDQDVSFDEINGYFVLYDNDAERVLKKFPRP
jgi:hypothetical protein